MFHGEIKVSDQFISQERSSESQHRDPLWHVLCIHAHAGTRSKLGLAHFPHGLLKAIPLEYSYGRGQTELSQLHEMQVCKAPIRQYLTRQLKEVTELFRLLKLIYCVDIA